MNALWALHASIYTSLRHLCVHGCSLTLLRGNSEVSITSLVSAQEHEPQPPRAIH